jgi:signal transduction histidine kinase
MELNSLEPLQAEYRQLQQALAARDAENVALHQQIAELARQLKAFERDRQLLGWEIHDGLVQEMTAASMFLSTVERQVAKDGTFTLATLQRGLDLVRKSIQEARQLIGSMTPANNGDRRGLVSAVKAVVLRFRDQFPIPVDFAAEEFAEPANYQLEWTVKRIVQEALTNAARHSMSPRIEVRLARFVDEAVITIRDFGVGFDPASPHPNHFGLASMCDRARQFGGSATIESQPGAGTSVVARLPLMPSE